MLFSVAVALMVILIAAFWTYQGFFSSIIMLLETLVAAVVAFAYYESINALWEDSIGAGLGQPLALMLLFLAVVLILRFISDKYIQNTINMPMYADRAGGAACGFLTGMILIGMALISIQMLPIGSTVLGFDRITADKNGNPQEHDFYFQPDRFTAGMVGMLSNQRFGGDNPLIYAKPDPLIDLYSARAVPQTEARVFLPPDVMEVKAYWETREIDHATYTIVDGATLSREYETHEPLGVNNKFLVCYVNIDPKAAKKDKLEIRFRLPQFRIVGPPPDSKGAFKKTPSVYLAAGMSNIYTHRQHGLEKVSKEDAKRLVRFSPTTNFILGPSETIAIAKVKRATGDKRVPTLYRFDVAFEVPEDFEPWYLEFKRGARFDFTTNKDLKRKEMPDWASSALGSGGPAGRADRNDTVGRAPGGRTHVANAIEERTGPSNEMPVVLSRSDNLVARHASGSKLRGGDNCHFFVELPDGEVDPAESVTEFAVPSGKRMFQVGAHKIEAKSTIGMALSFASNTLAQVHIKNSNGKKYYAIGQYAATEVNGKPIFEIQYYPQALRPARCLKKPKKITRSVLKKAGPKNYKFGYLFLVDPGVEIVSYHGGGKNKKQILNYQVPD